MSSFSSSRSASRKKNFKKGISADDSRRRREETTISLRKNKREESLAKRRNLKVNSWCTPTKAESKSSSTFEEEKSAAPVSGVQNLPALVSGKFVHARQTPPICLASFLLHGENIM